VEYQDKVIAEEQLLVAGLLPVVEGEQEVLENTTLILIVVMVEQV